MSDGDPERPIGELHLWEIRGVRDVLIALLVAALFWLGYAMRDVTIPLLVALLLAYLFEPVIAWMARTRWIPFGRIGGVSLLLTTITLVLIVGLGLFVPRVVTQAADLVGDVRSGLVRERLARFVDEYVPTAYRADAKMLVSELPAGDIMEAAAPADGRTTTGSKTSTSPTDSSSGTDTSSSRKQASQLSMATNAVAAARDSSSAAMRASPVLGTTESMAVPN